MQYMQNLALNYLPVSFLRNRLAHSVKVSDCTGNTDRQLLIDVSVIYKNDAGTGIQRVVRNLYHELLAAPPAGYRICPIAANRKQAYCYLPPDFLQQAVKQSPCLPMAPVQSGAGDLFLGLDLGAHIIPYRISELFQWKQQGTRMCFFVYDLLPLIEPEWFNPKTTQNFHRWLRALAILADDVITTSQTVKNDFAVIMQRTYGIDDSKISTAIISLGAELNSAILPQASAAQTLPPQLMHAKFILMVGTIEPRKGHADVLEAFEQLWARGDQTQLVIAGKQGWKVEPLIQHLQTHAEADKRLHWLNNPDDNMLLTLYQHCGGVIMASKGEGFGLPLIEAAYFNKPLLVRDIPVFREIAGDTVTYFSATGHRNLTQTLPLWLAILATKNGIPPSPTWITWQESCAQLVRALLSPMQNISAPPIARTFRHNKYRVKVHHE